MGSTQSTWDNLLILISLLNSNLELMLCE